VVGIVVPPSIFLGLEQSSAHLGEEVIAISEQGVDGLQLCRAPLLGKQSRRGTTIDDLERRSTKRGVERRVVAELGPGQPLQPCAWTIASDATKVHGDGLVDGLRLAIGLRVERGTHPQLDACKLEELPPNVAGEHRVAVADY
jgi:hypothetical protein